MLIASFTKVTVTDPLQLSPAVIAVGFGSGTSLAQETVMSGKHVSVGTVASNTVMI